MTIPQGFKNTLEDKRILRFGVPDCLYKDYLLAEQFVVDIDFFRDDKMIGEISATYDDLVELGLDKPPFEKYVVHAVSDGLVISSFVDRPIQISEERNGIYPLYEEQHYEKIKNGINDERDQLYKDCAILASVGLVVFLATNNVNKERHIIKTSQDSKNGIPHKKGSGGYTILSAPVRGDGSGCHAGTTVRPHFRRGHIRRLNPLDKSRWVWVSPCFIHGEPETQRVAYIKKQYNFV